MEKWMAGMLAAGMLLAQPAAAFADDPAADAVTSESVASSSAETPAEQEAPDSDESAADGGEAAEQTEDTGEETPEETGADSADESGDNPDAAEGQESPDEAANDSEQDPAKEADADPAEEPETITEEIVIEEEADDKQEETAEEKEETSTNEQLVAGQQIVHAPVIIEDFRFWTVARRYAFAKEADTAILEEMRDDARTIGTLPENGLCYVLKEEEQSGTTWLYVESGDVRGFVQDDRIYSGRRAQMILEQYQEVSEDAESGELTTKLSADVPMAEAAVDPLENGAFAWLRATADQTIIQKDYALATDRVGIREEKDADSRKVGILDVGGLCYIIADRGDEWVYVESGDVRGFVNRQFLRMDEEAYQAPSEVKQEEPAEIEIAFEIDDGSGSAEATAEQTTAADDTPASDTALEAERAEETDGDAEESEPDDPLAAIDQKTYPVYYEVIQQGEDQFAKAEQKVEPEENQACYYTLTSPFPGTPGGKIRDSLVSYASEYVGNPYVWGGTSLTGGADCSGFVQSIYAQYGYSLPRTSGEQSQYGLQIPVDEAEPGDLIFYAENGKVYHVVIYAGEGRTIEAMNESRGITYGNVLTSDAVWATRILEDEYEEVIDFSSDIGAQNATQAMYGEDLGEFKITYYCPCAECNGSNAGQSATGAPLIQGRTIAVDPSVIPYGTQVIIGGHVFTAEDCGGAIKGKRIDVFVNEHQMCNALGTTMAHVYLTN